MSGAAKWNERGAGTGTERNAMMRNGVGSETDRKKGTEMRNRTHREVHPSTTPQLFILMYTRTPETAVYSTVCTTHRFLYSSTSTPETEKSNVYSFYDLRTEKSTRKKLKSKPSCRGLARQLRVLPGVKQYAYMR